MRRLKKRSQITRLKFLNRNEKDTANTIFINIYDDLLKINSKDVSLRKKTPNINLEIDCLNMCFQKFA